MGYDSDMCEINVDDYIDNCCLNNDSCVDGFNSYTCVCSPGYISENYSVTLNDCDQDPCINNAHFVNDPSPGSYSCSCLDGFTGSHCEMNINEYPPSPHLNGPTCMDGINQYDCIFVDGYTSNNRYTNTDDCLPHPCMNNGTCSDMVNVFKCTCITGYTGIMMLR